MLVRSSVTFALCGSIALAALPNSAAATNRALLIGVSNYELAAIAKLKAPGNDVRLVWDALRERGFADENVVVLADDLTPGQGIPQRLARPTANNILAGLDELATKVRQGDLIVVYYSGHGTVMRQSTPKIGEHIEPTGNDEVLLAIDAKPYDPIKNELEGGIVDKVLKNKFDALKKKAFLWLILDSCHSGGFTRDASIGVSVHFVDPKILNLPVATENAVSTSQEAYENPWINHEIGNKQVAFLAAPEEYPAFEKELGSGGRYYSLFTHTLVTTLGAEKFSSYRQLARAVSRVEAGIPGNVPPPVFEGDLDQPMFDGSADGPRNWLAHADPKMGEIDVDAGELQGMRIGTVVSLERDGRVLGYGQIVGAEVATSRAKPVAFDGHPVTSLGDLGEKLSVSVIRPAVSFALKVALPAERTGAIDESTRIALAAISRLAHESESTLPIEWVKGGDSGADLHLRLIGGVIYLVMPTAELVRAGRNRTPAVKILADVDSTARSLKDNLWLVLRQLNLRRIASEMRDEGLANAVEVKLGLIRDGAEVIRLVRNEKQVCKSWDKPADELRQEPIIAGRSKAIRLTHCDRVAIQITNRWSKPVDITLLYLDSEAGIGMLDRGRIPANEAYRPQEFQPVRIVTWCGKVWALCKDRPEREYEPIGTERLLVIIAEADQSSQDPRTFEYLVQPTLANAEEKKHKPGRRGAADSFEQLLRDAALVPDRTRGEVEREGDATMKIISWDVVLPKELARQK